MLLLSCWLIWWFRSPHSHHLVCPLWLWVSRRRRVEVWTWVKDWWSHLCSLLSPDTPAPLSPSDTRSKSPTCALPATPRVSVRSCPRAFRKWLTVLFVTFVLGGGYTPLKSTVCAQMATISTSHVCIPLCFMWWTGMCVQEHTWSPCVNMVFLAVHWTRLFMEVFRLI